MPTGSGRWGRFWRGSPPPERKRPYSPLRFSQYAQDLSRAVDAMRIRITEPVFFQGSQRRVGEQLDVTVGPYRTQIIPGGLSRIPQFVEMPEEIKQVIQEAVKQTVAPGDVGSVAAVLPSVTLPQQATNALAPAQAPQTAAQMVAPAKVAPKANPLAARVRALTTRRAKFQDYAASVLGAGETAMTQIEANGPAILERSVQASQDELTAITDLGDLLKEMDRLNSVPNS